MDPRPLPGLRTAAAAYTLVQDALMDLRSSREKIREALAALPVLGKDALADVDLEEPCPICLVSLSSILASADAAAAAAENEEGGNEGESEDTALAGVTKLVGCGHIFCRRDLTEWIRSQHGSCPTCRHTFLHIQPFSAGSDDESSDGGEYLPGADDFEDEDEDAYLDVDGFTDADADDFPVERMDVEFDRPFQLQPDGDYDDTAIPNWGESSAMGDTEMTDAGEDDFEQADQGYEWGLTDGESESMASSEAGDMTAADEEATAAVANGASARRRSALWMVQLTAVALLLFSAGSGG
ncbi:hypothetical protein HYPSUDRAFT_32081 [Hypholoma sublateritium FD-334 SS-4]|uniref:RING-type domain-containing protein n=1 Tax=Hypholoma sublateritium (strain FD-334 SS-4) TaxID=945553 RepID=A0A0D2LPG5_HYPSF|nr:hypothetical protein HYPSUDRAFT_32081 [Hypholoma sublateritium FD-334 SS-4]